MRIGCLAWGSLVWKTGDLRPASPWFDDGPSLPIEFCRVDDKGELSTALCEGAPCVPTCWCLLDAATLADAREQLRRREGIPSDQPESVGSVPSVIAGLPNADAVATWALRHELDAVVWTALPPRFDDVNGRVPSADEAVAYLDALTGDDRARAEYYVRHVPRAFATPIRAAVERALGWTPLA